MDKEIINAIIVVLKQKIAELEAELAKE